MIFNHLYSIYCIIYFENCIQCIAMVHDHLISNKRLSSYSLRNENCKMFDFEYLFRMYLVLEKTH